MALVSTPANSLGQALPTFSLPAVNGPAFDSATLPKDCAVVVMFICNHCPYVKAIEYRLIELGRDLRERSIPLVGICSNDSEAYPEDSFENLRLRAKEKNYPFIYLHDEDQSIAKKFGAVCTPDFFVYDRQHRLAYRGRLDDSWRDPARVSRRELYEATLALQAGQTLKSPEHPSMGCSMKWKE